MSFKCYYYYCNNEWKTWIITTTIICKKERESIINNEWYHLDANPADLMSSKLLSLLLWLFELLVEDVMEFWETGRRISCWGGGARPSKELRTSSRVGAAALLVITTFSIVTLTAIDPDSIEFLKTNSFFKFF